MIRKRNRNIKYLVILALIASFLAHPTKVYALADIPQTEKFSLSIATKEGFKTQHEYSTFAEAEVAMENSSDPNAVVLNLNRTVGNGVADMKDGIVVITAEKTNKEILELGYTYVNNGNDAYFYSSTGTTVKLGISGCVTDGVPIDQIELIPRIQVTGQSHYSVNINGNMVHSLVKYTWNSEDNKYSTSASSSYTICKAPSFATKGVNYYSDDGYTFFSTPQMKASTYAGTYYMYYKYLPFRSTTSYTAEELNSYIAYRLMLLDKTNSVLIGKGQAFIDAQNNYGVNAALLLSIAINESACGTSTSATLKNNLFGINALDCKPDASYSYESVEKCIDFEADRMISQGYTDSNTDSRYFGSNLGNKRSGINVKYASDPYWGEKIASVASELDRYLGGKDYNKYKLAFSNSITDAKIQPEMSSATVYKLANLKNNYPVNIPILIDDKVGSFYKIQSDMPMNAAGTANCYDKYDFDLSKVYVDSTKFTLLNVLEVPIGLTAIVPTTYGGSDGKITGTSTAMEYKNTTDSKYKAVTGAEITGLAAGTYDVRYAATTEYRAGEDAVVEVGEGNIAAGKTLTSPSAFNKTSFVTDGYKGTDKYSDSMNSGLQYIQMDLGAYYDLTEVNLWHYFGDGRTYHDVIVQVSNDPTFATDVTTVYNNDTDNSVQLGTGKDAEYAETSAGKTIQFEKVNARYVRLYSNGSTANGWNHYVEVEAYGFEGPLVSASSVSLDKASDTIAVGGTSALTASVMPLNTADKSVTWSTSDASVVTVDSSGNYTAVAPGNATITATTADGGLKAACSITVTAAPANFAAGKAVTSSAAFTSPAFATDGYKSTDKYASSINSGLSWIQVDMGASYYVNHVNLWHYFLDGRTYHDVIVQFSDDPNFVNNVTTVYNNDTDNSAKLSSAGKDTEYAETSAGKGVDFTLVKARYARIYSNGSTANGWNHLVEVEISKEVQRTNYAKGAAATTSSSFKNLNVATDNSVNTGYADGYAGLHWIQYDLGSQQDINEINLWHYFLDGRTYHDVIVQVSNDPTFATGAKTVFNNDANNSAGLGAGSDTEYAETSAGKSITFATEKAQYVRLYSNGSSINTYNHYVEVEICNNLAAGLQATSSPGFTSLNSITDGNKTAYANGSTGLQWIQYDLGSVKDINEVNLWHYYLDGRTYHDVIVQVSNDPDFATGVTTVYNNDTNNSALMMAAGTDSEYAETAAGKKITFSTKKAQYVRIYSNGSSINAYNHYVEVEICNNLAAGKTAAATSSAFTNMGSLTDGNKSSGYAEGLISGLQWVQLDLGATKSINRINLWHYFLDGRTYHDVIVQVSNDPTFATGVKTVYNNDKDNSAGFGAGSDSEYAETSAGKTIDFSAADARYVRIYSNGSTANGWNHIVELEVLGN